jgi:predicted DNA-binding transcriptional regulator AlpA
MRRLAACALELAVRLKLNADGSLEVLGPFEGSMAGEEESQSSITSASLSSSQTLKYSPATPTEPSQLMARAPPLRGRRLRQECLSLTETAYELAVSRSTLWRASRSNLPDFPEPVIVSRQVYWKKSDLARLEDAMMFFEGRCAFDRKRKAAQSGG